MVMAVPFLESLRASVNDEIWGIGKSNAIHIYNGLNLLDRYIPLDKKDIVSFFDAVSFLKKTEFKRGIILPHSFRSALLFYMAGIKERIGYARNKRGFMLTKHAPETLTLESTTRHYMRIIDMLGGRRTENETPLLFVTQDEELRYYEQYTDLDKPYIVFVIGAQYGSSKCWPPVYFSELADMIVQRLEMMVYLLPGKDEKGLARDVLDGSIQKEGIEIMDMDVRDLKVCLSRASLVVSNDTGPRHISAALSVPTVVLLGPMDARYTDYPSAYTHLISADIPCRPCNRRVCDRDHGCMKQITPETVFRKLEEILG